MRNFVTLKNNLHVIGYSTPINKVISFNKLKIYFILRNYHMRYHTLHLIIKKMGFCIQYSEFKKLKEKKYKVYINSKFTNGNLVIGEKLIKGKSKKEILFSSYLCHPPWPIMSFQAL